MRYRSTIWPRWSQTVDDMIDQGANVRACCRKCRTFFIVDLEAIRAVKGGDYSLINRTSRCRIARCDGVCFFLGAASEGTPLRPLTSD